VYAARHWLKKLYSAIVANTRSAQKAMRQAERRSARNRAARSAVRTYVKTATEAVAAGSADDASESVHAAVRALDKAAQKGIVHRNAAARRKSRLMSRLFRLSIAPVQAPEASKAPTRRARATADKKTAGRKPTSGSRRRS
jgi:small subunit ribosomal protein S20